MNPRAPAAPSNHPFVLRAEVPPMRRALLPLVLLAAVVVALALAWLVLTAGDAGGEPAPSQSLAVGAFRSLEVVGHAEVILVQGDDEAVDVAAVAKRRARVHVRSEGGRLFVGAFAEAPWWAFLAGGSSARPPRITVRFRQLDEIALSGAVKLSSDAVRTPALDVRASGAATVRIGALDTGTLRFAGSGAVTGELAGRAAEQVVSISGAGAYRAGKLASERAQVRGSGAGRVLVHASRELDAAISGAGAIDYVGDPSVTQRISGAGRIRRVGGGGREAMLPGLLAAAFSAAPGSIRA